MRSEIERKKKSKEKLAAVVAIARYIRSEGFKTGRLNENSFLALSRTRQKKKIESKNK